VNPTHGLIALVDESAVNGFRNSVFVCTASAIPGIPNSIPLNVPSHPPGIDYSSVDPGTSTLFRRVHGTWHKCRVHANYPWKQSFRRGTYTDL
jgi:hypothetical protein